LARLVPAVPLLAFNPFAKPVVELKLVTLHFKDHHGKMMDYTADWQWGSTPFSTPHWTYGKKSVPISHTMDAPVPVRIEVDVFPTNADETEFEITGAGKFANLEFSTKVKLKGGRHELTLTSKAGLEKKVQRLDGDIEWSAKDPKGKVFAMGSSWGHEIYVTIATPIDVDGREKGVNLKRMRKAVELVGAVRNAAGAPTTDPHTIVDALFKKFPQYALISSPAVPHGDPPGTPDYKHATYFNDLGGAWVMADYISETGECQAIVRFVRALIKQMGCPGTAETVVVWEDPDIDGGNTPQEALHGSSGGAGLGDKSKVVGGKRWFAYLCDRDPEKVGAVFDTDQPTTRYMGLNNFEACLRFDAPDASGSSVKKWYAGGTGGLVLTRYEDVPKRSFKALCWVTIQGTKPNRTCRIEQIVKRY